jgi:hypothetical protein
MSTRVLVITPDRGSRVGVTIHTQDEDGDWPQTQVMHVRPGQMSELFVSPKQRIVLFDPLEQPIDVPRE